MRLELFFFIKVFDSFSQVFSSNPSPSLNISWFSLILFRTIYVDAGSPLESYAGMQQKIISDTGIWRKNRKRKLLF